MKITPFTTVVTQYNITLSSSELVLIKLALGTTTQNSLKNEGLSQKEASYIYDIYDEFARIVDNLKSIDR